jgi:class 3 adenylate cyclase
LSEQVEAMKKPSRAGSEPVRARNRKIENPKRVNAQKASLSFRQTLNRIKNVRLSALPDRLTETLRPFMTPKKYQKGEVVFHQGDLAKEMFLITTGKFRVTEIDVELPPGRFFGDLGFFAPGNQRTATVECIEDGHVLSITYEELLKLFVQKPEIGYYSLALSAAATVQAAQLLRELREKNFQLERSYSLVQQQASQLEVQSQELVKFNRQLEQRVADQVGEIERMSRLRRFIPPQVADLIVASGTEKQLESHRREITALFCDLRGFTGFSESSDPEDVMALLREYHAAIGEIVVRYSGTLERYAGDGVMVVFNDPIPVDNPALQAVQIALEMRGAISELTEKWRQLGHEIGFGIGIAHGYATLGTIGFEGRFDYAAIGTVSNVASRLCDEAKPGQILISPRVLMAVKDAATVEPVGEFELKGIRRPIAAYNVLAASAPNH